MISSPGAAFGAGRIDYTTDCAPIELRWFDADAYLAESCQIYLELALLQSGVSEVYSIYNSFRREHSDPTHLSEFHHIEFEGQMDRSACVAVADGLVRLLLQATLDGAKAELEMFLLPQQIDGLAALAERSRLFEEVTLKECYQRLYEDTGDTRYTRFTLEGRFGLWEEVRLTELYGAPLALTGYPLLEVPFYHDEEPESNPRVARNTDFIWPGYTEVLGAGQRISDLGALEEKAMYFNLPRDSYEPYLRARERLGYQPSSGFGLGWERLVQGILSLPEIVMACPFPRTHLGTIP